jgi:hypothetical protein
MRPFVCKSLSMLMPALAFSALVALPALAQQQPHLEVCFRLAVFTTHRPVVLLPGRPPMQLL